RLLALERNQSLLGFDLVALGHENLDDLDIGEIAKIRDRDGTRRGIIRACLAGRRARSASGGSTLRRVSSWTWRLAGSPVCGGRGAGSRARAGRCRATADTGPVLPRAGRGLTLRRAGSTVRLCLGFRARFAVDDE